MFALDKDNGEVVWEKLFDHYMWSSPVDVGSSPSSTNQQINQMWDHVHLTTHPLKKSEQNLFH